MIWLSDKEKVNILRGALRQSIQALLALARMHNINIDYASSFTAAAEKALEDTAPKG